MPALLGDKGRVLAECEEQSNGVPVRAACHVSDLVSGQHGDDDISVGGKGGLLAVDQGHLLRACAEPLGPLQRLGGSAGRRDEYGGLAGSTRPARIAGGEFDDRLDAFSSQPPCCGACGVGGRAHAREQRPTGSQTCPWRVGFEAVREKLETIGNRVEVLLEEVRVHQRIVVTPRSAMISASRRTPSSARICSEISAICCRSAASARRPSMAPCNSSFSTR